MILVWNAEGPRRTVDGVMDGARRSMINKDHHRGLRTEDCDGVKFLWDKRYLLYCIKMLNKKVKTKGSIKLI